MHLNDRPEYDANVLAMVPTPALMRSKFSFPLRLFIPLISVNSIRCGFAGLCADTD